MTRVDKGVSADADRATAVEPVPVSPLRDGIADAVARLDRSTWDSRVMPDKQDIRALLDAARATILPVVDAIRAYLPPDGIDTQECINRILAATDNRTVAPFIAEIENGRA